MKRNDRSFRPMSFLANNSAFVAVLAISIFGALAVPHFASEANTSSILNQYSIIGLLALGQLLVIISGGVDLSQGGMVALYSIVAAVMMKSYPPVLAIAVATLVVLFLGCVNGFLVARAKMPPFIVTFGVLQVCRGVALMIANARPVAIKYEAFTNLGFLAIANIPLSTIVWVIASLIVALILSRRKIGRHIYAIGSNEEGTRLSGVNVMRTKFLVYVFAAACVSVGALMWTARVKSGQPIGASGYELETIAAVVVGGGSLSGGKGTVFGCMCGVLLFGVISSILNLIGVPPLWQGMVKGAVMLLAVSLGEFQKRIRPAEERVYEQAC